jgi:exodeoxyribonuclease VIII
MIIHGMTDAEYHARPELSSTGARLLLPEYGGSPAKFKYRQGKEFNTPAFDLGKAVHARVLGVGAQAIAYPDDVLAANGAASTKAAKDWAEQVRAEGHVPMKAADLQPIEDMAEAVLAHPEAREVLETVTGREVSIFADVDGVPTRARFDIYGNNQGGDVKTAVDASPEGFNRAVAKYGLHVQGGWYDAAHTAETGIALDGFKFLVVEKTAPYLVGVYDLDAQWREIGRDRAQVARETWAECTRTGTWPGYASGTLSCPPYVVYRHEDTYEEIQI